jgi:hypothetical protein
MQDIVDKSWLGGVTTNAFQGVSSNTVGALLSTAVKDGIAGGWHGINFADEFSSGLSSASGQFGHQAAGTHIGNFYQILYLLQHKQPSGIYSITTTEASSMMHHLREYSISISFY